MVNTQILHYIEKELSEGFSEEKIREALKRVGYQEEDINSAWEAVSKKHLEPIISTPASFPTKVPERKPNLSEIISKGRNMKHTHLFFGILAIIIIVIGGLMIGSHIIENKEISWIKKKPGEETPFINKTTPLKEEVIVQPDKIEEVQLPERAKVPEEAAKPVALSPSEIEQSFLDWYNDCVQQYEETADLQCLALGSRDPKECEKAKDNKEKQYCKDDLYLYNAIQNQDASLCNNMVDPERRAGCELVISGDSSGCDFFQDQDLKLYCIAGVTNDPSKCEQIENMDQRVDCNDEVLLARSIITGTDSPCNDILEGDVKSRCFAFINNDPSLCTSDIEQSCNDYANHMIASQTYDAQFCEEIVDEGLKDQCLANMKSYSDTFYLNYAMNYNLIEACEKVSNIDKKEACVTILKRDLEGCLEIENQGMSGYCISMLAQLTKNPGLCDQHPISKQECMEYFMQQ